MAGFISDDSQGTRQKVTWADPNSYVDPNDKGDAANRQDGGWYFNKDTGYVEMWKADGGSGGSNQGGSNSISSLGNNQSSAGSASINLPERPKIDLQAEYDSLYDSLGLSGMKDSMKQTQQEILALRADADNAKNLVNENPFFSEGNRVGRISKIEEAYNQKASVLTAQAALRQQEYQDAQNNLWQQMGLKQQQYQYDYTAAQDNFNQMNYLLEKGALDDADEASLERMAATNGISAAMLRSMINAQKQKNVNPQLLQNVDDNGNVTLTLIDGNTGKTINKQVLEGVAQKSKTTTGSGGLTAKQQADADSATISRNYDSAVLGLAQANLEWAAQNGQAASRETPYLYEDQWQAAFVEWQQATGGSYPDFIKKFGHLHFPNPLSEE